MALFIEESPGVFAEWVGQPIAGVKYPSSWPTSDLLAKGLFDPIVPDVPDGKRVISSTVQRVAGQVKYVYVLEDMTEDELYLPLEKWRFFAILDIAGLTATLISAIDDVPDVAFRAVAKAKLNDPPGGMFYRSDPLFHNEYLQMRLGMTDDEINAMWLQAAAIDG